MTPELTALVARLEAAAEAERDTLRTQLESAQTTLRVVRAAKESAQAERDTLRTEVAAEKAAHWRTCQTAAHEADERDKLQAEVAALKEQNVEFLDQARQGLMIDHDCPAVFACAYILAQLTPESEQVDSATSEGRKG